MNNSSPPLKKAVSLVEASSTTAEDVIKLTGTRMIDEAVIGLCPKIGNFSDDKQRQLADMIDAFLSTREAMLERIATSTNSEVAEYLDSAKKMAEEETHGLIGDLEVLLEERAKRALKKWQECR